MCGNFDLMFAKKNSNLLISEIQDLDIDINENFYPSSNVFTFTDGDNRLEKMHWGLIPHWAKDKKIGLSMFNARLETIEEKKSFSNLLDKNRCIVLASNYYEWKSVENQKKKQKYKITIKDNPVFCFAGLYTKWVDKTTGEIIKSTTIVTTEPDLKLSEIHHRMPFILRNSDIYNWLNTKEIKFKELKEVLKPVKDIFEIEAI
jgi:putative SOS response-associated peptidase YedK